MNPESQSGGTADNGEQEKPKNNGENISVQDKEAAPVAAAESEEQHFFRTDNAPDAQTPALPDDSGNGSMPPSSQLDPRMQDDGRAVTWVGPEFIDHEKGLDWYLVLGIVSVVLVGIVALITRSIFLTVVAVFVCIIFGIGAARKPREMHYAVDNHGVTVGRSFHSYSDFRAFSTAPEGKLLNLTFIPLKRFMPPMSVYLDPADHDRITEVLTSHLPLEEHQADPIERLMRRIRF